MTIAEAGEKLKLILWRHLAMPLEDHDGGDEDDRLVRGRQFLRACRHPGSSIFVGPKRGYPG